MSYTLTDRGTAGIASGSSATVDMQCSSFTPPAGCLLLMLTTGLYGATGITHTPSDTFSGTGPWTKVEAGGTELSTNTIRTTLAVAKAGASPGSGTMKMTRSGGTISIGAETKFFTLEGTGTLRLVQGATGVGAGTSLAATFRTTPKAASYVIGGIGHAALATPGVTQPSGWTEQRDAQDAQLANHEVATKNGSAVINPTWSSIDNSSGANAYAVALEIMELTAGQVDHVKEVGFVTNTTSATTGVITVGLDGVPVGAVLTIRGSADNAGTNGAIQSITAADNSSQSGTANTYTSVGTHAIADPGAANAGIEGFAFVCVVTRPLLAGDTITVTFGTATAAKAIASHEWAGVNTTTPVLGSSYSTQDNQTGTTNSLAVTPSASGQAVLTAIAVEGGTADGFTEDADTTDGSWVTQARNGSGTTTSGATLNTAYKLVTGTTAQAYGPTLGTARDHCGLIFVLDKATGNQSVALPVAALTIAGVPPTASGSGAASTTLPVAAVTLAGVAPSASGSGAVSATLPVAAVTIAGVPPGTSVGGVSAALPVAAVTIAGLAPSAAPSGAAPAPLPVAALTVAGVAPSAVGSGGTSVTLPVAAITIAGRAPVASLPSSGSWCEDFNLTDGDINGQNGWSAPIGGSNHAMEVHGGRAAVDDSFLYVDGARTLPFAVGDNTDWQISFDTVAPLISGNGGTTFAIFNSGNGHGIGGFIGNASHVYWYDPTQHAATNDSRPGEGTHADLFNHVDFMHYADGSTQIYLDGVLWSHSNAGDIASAVGPFDIFYLSLGASEYPTTQSWVDNACVYDHIAGAQQSVALPPATITIAGVAPSAAPSGAAAVALPPAALTLTGLAPSAAGSGVASTTLPTAAVTLTGVAPSASGSGSISSTLPVAALSLAGVAPSAAPGGVSVALPVAALTIAGVAPAGTGSGAASVALPIAALTLAGLAPVAQGSGVVSAALPIAALSIAGVAPGAGVGTQFVDVPVAALTLTGIAPSAAPTGAAPVALPPAALTLAGVPPTAAGSGSISAALPLAALQLAGVPLGTSAGAVSRVLPVASLVLSGVPLVGAGSGAALVQLPVAGLNLAGLAPSAAATGAAPVVLPVAQLVLAGVPLVGIGAGSIAVPLPVAALTLLGVALGVVLASESPRFEGPRILIRVDPRRVLLEAEERRTISRAGARRTLGPA